jgi:phosphoserine phosphatase
MIILTKGIFKKNEFSKLAVFDLDGTLYSCNSHIEILNKRYRFRIFDSIVVKAFGKVFNKTYLKILHLLYNKIPKEFVENFTPEFRESALTLLEEKKSEGYHILIVSNAPKELIKTAASRLNVDWLQAEIGFKDMVVLKNYQYNKLFVCTDNLSDISLLNIADERVIYVTKKTKGIFCEKYPQAQILEV